MENKAMIRKGFSPRSLPKSRPHKKSSTPKHIEKSSLFVVSSSSKNIVPFGYSDFSMYQQASLSIVLECCGFNTYLHDASI
jgi:hypothetical protein